MAEDYYKILGVSRTATPEEIQKAFRTVAANIILTCILTIKKPKRSSNRPSKHLKRLTTKKKRKMYDQFGSDYEKFGAGGGPYPGVAARDPIPAAGNPGAAKCPKGWTESISVKFLVAWVAGGGGGFGNIFEQLRGGRGGGGRAKKAKTPPPAGADVQESITVPFNTAIQGGKIDLQIAPSRKIARDAQREDSRRNCRWRPHSFAPDKVNHRREVESPATFSLSCILSLTTFSRELAIIWKSKFQSRSPKRCSVPRSMSPRHKERFPSRFQPAHRAASGFALGTRHPTQRWELAAICMP